MTFYDNVNVNKNDSNLHISFGATMEVKDSISPINVDSVIENWVHF